jgi:hypothetical protein
MTVIQCAHCGSTHIARTCKVCDTAYCQKYAEIYKKGNGECCSKECTIVIMDRWKKAQGEL